MKHFLSHALAIAICASPVTLPVPARAWGEYGHLTVCDLAYRNFTPATRKALVQLFQVRSGGITIPTKPDVEGRHYTSFNVGCLEEDTRPRKHPQNHFINVPRDTAAISGGVCPANASGRLSDCILAGIERDLAILKDPSRSNQDRVIALMAIGHWVGDIHQPLHVSFKDDAGGNGIKARYRGDCGPRSRPRNLHSVWDNCLLEAGLFDRVRKRADFKPSWAPRTITYRAVDTLKANTTAAEQAAFVSTQPWQWAAESYAITLDPAVQYCIKAGASCQYADDRATLDSDGTQRAVVVDQAYLDRFKGIAEERVRKAGFRLAHLINLALDPAYTTPT